MSITPDLFGGPSHDVVPEAVPVTAIEGQPYSLLIQGVLWNASDSHPRSRQAEIGPSQLGLSCSRQIAYQLADTAPVNFDIDPMPSLVGTAMHAWMSDQFRQRAPAGRFLVEHRVTYRGVSGTLDLYDRRSRTLYDWKFPKLAKARRARTDGAPRHYWWQLQTYAAGLQLAGETPARVVVAYMPVDGRLDDVTALAQPVDRAQADDAIDRLETLRQQLAAAEQPGAVPAQPSRLCPWCPYHRPGWAGDLNVACPGDTT